MTKPQNSLVRCLSTKLSTKPAKSILLNSLTNPTGGPEWKQLKALLPTPKKQVDGPGPTPLDLPEVINGIL